MFIVERYLPAVPPGELAAAVERDRRAAAGMTAAGIPVRHLSTIYVPSDESCFSLFDAPSADALREAQERAGIGFERIVEAVQLPAQDQPRTGSVCHPQPAPVFPQGDSQARTAP
jgi:uncharacterized protein DUF4242